MISTLKYTSVMTEASALPRRLDLSQDLPIGEFLGALWRGDLLAD